MQFIQDDISSIQKKVFPNDEKLIKTIWKFLELEDKLNCRLVCKRFNEIITGKNFLGTNVYFPSKVEFIPKLTSNHERVIIQNLQCYSLGPEICQIFEQFKDSLIYLKLVFCTFDLMTFYELLRKLSVIESMELRNYFENELVDGINK